MSGVKARRGLWWGIALFALISILLSACGGQPPEPTVPPARTVTATVDATPTGSGSITPPPTITLLPTWTPAASVTPLPTLRTLPSPTPLPPTATLDPAGEAPPAIRPNTARGRDVILTRAQINAALARAFDSAPFSSYSAAPTIDLGFNFLTLKASLIPLGSPIGASPIEAELMIQFRQPGGYLETYPVELVPLDARIGTRLIKASEGLLRDVILRLLERAVEGEIVFVSAVTVRPEALTITIVRQGE